MKLTINTTHEYMCSDNIWIVPECHVALTQSTWTNSWQMRNTRKKTKSVLTWHKSSTTSCGADWESPEDVQTGMQRWSFPEGLVHIAFTSYPLHARWHPSHGFPDRLLDSRWLGVIGESILIHNSRLLWLGGKTHISVLTLLKRHQKGGALYCRSDIHVSPYFCNKTERRGIFTLHALNFIAFKIRAIVTFYEKCGLLFSACIPLWGTSWGANS